MDKSKDLYEKASQELNEFRERRIAERRSTWRGTPDRRQGQNEGLQENVPNRNLH